MKLTFYPYTLNFKFTAGTSRGALKTKDTFIIKVSNESSDGYGLGECGPLKRLSVDDTDLAEQLSKLSEKVDAVSMPTSQDEAYEQAQKLVGDEFPSIRFGLETAFLDYINGGERVVFDNDFARGDVKIPINGLVWMGHMEDMLLQITSKVDQGFDCVKMKIGSLDFDKECDILQYIRRKYYQRDIMVRVDANGAFKPADAMEKLERLSQYDLHSIEQPVAVGQWDLMKQLCQDSPVPIALDEELIGIYKKEGKQELLETLRPQYIILKPTLVGGFQSCNEWIKLAESMDIGWWLTSALESNIGLNAICQYAAELKTEGHQGLGTGQLYHNNFQSPLEIKDGHISHGSKSWDISMLKV